MFHIGCSRHMARMYGSVDIDSITRYLSVGLLDGLTDGLQIVVSFEAWLKILLLLLKLYILICFSLQIAVANNGRSLPRGSKTYVMKKMLKTLTGGSTDHNIFLQIFSWIALKVERPGPIFSFSRHNVYPSHPSNRQRQKQKTVLIRRDSLK